MRIAVLSTQVPFTRGGAEVLADSLQRELQRAGHEVALVTLPFAWYSPENILESMLAASLVNLTEAQGTKIDRMIGLKFPAYLAPHPNKVMWLVHQHRDAYELWDSPYSDLIRHPLGAQVRATIRTADQVQFREAKAVYSISKTVCQRLETECGIASAPLYPPPPNPDQFHCLPDTGFLYFPSRLTSIKRQELALEALALTREPVRLRFSGRADDPLYATVLHDRARKLGIASRVEFLGTIDQREHVRHYAEARAVVFPPFDEDYGYVTLEAMLSSKAVLTCTDSGGPLEFVSDGHTGLVSAPNANALASAMDHLWSDRQMAQSLGEAGRHRYERMEIKWDTVIKKLTR